MYMDVYVYLHNIISDIDVNISSYLFNFILDVIEMKVISHKIMMMITQI